MDSIGRGGHESGKQVTQSLLDRCGLSGRFVALRSGIEGGYSVVGKKRGEFGNIGQERRDAGGWEETTEGFERRDSDGHFRLFDARRVNVGAVCRKLMGLHLVIAVWTFLSVRRGVESDENG